MVRLSTAKFNIQNIYVLPTEFVNVFCKDLRTSSGYDPVQNQMAGFYNQDGVCLLRGTIWLCKRNSPLI